MNQGFIQFLIKLAIFIVKTGQVNNALRIAIWAVKTKANYDEAMDRLTGVYYDRQVHAAADRYLAGQPAPKVSVPGFDRWKSEQTALPRKQ